MQAGGPVSGTHAVLFTFPNRIIFGVGTRGELATELKRLRITCPLIVTKDAGLVASGLAAEVAC